MSNIKKLMKDNNYLERMKLMESISGRSTASDSNSMSKPLKTSTPEVTTAQASSSVESAPAPASSPQHNERIAWENFVMVIHSKVLEIAETIDKIPGMPSQKQLIEDLKEAKKELERAIEMKRK